MAKIKVVPGAGHWGRMGRQKATMQGNSLDITKTETEITTRVDLGTQNVGIESGQIRFRIVPRTNFSSAELTYTKVVG
jgi:hypothetical protein